MDSVTDICKYHYLCLLTIILVKVISGHQVKRSNQKKSGFRAVMQGLCQIFAKIAKNDPKTPFEASKSVKKENY